MPQNHEKNRHYGTNSFETLLLRDFVFPSEGYLPEYFSEVCLTLLMIFLTKFRGEGVFLAKIIANKLTIFNIHPPQVKIFLVIAENLIRAFRKRDRKLLHCLSMVSEESTFI